MNCDECNGIHGHGGVKVENAALIKKSNHGHFLIDECVEELVRLLNKAGVKTIASCCGHGNEGNLLISLDSLEFYNLGEEMRVILKLPRAKDLKRC
ncbi:hypothetical protein KAR91_44435 [Candidatus Pacearchaeota archaeon]|nr:hypothetical protein [Candidatus Pacearchaeota archaeon]